MESFGAQVPRKHLSFYFGIGIPDVKIADSVLRGGRGCGSLSAYRCWRTVVGMNPCFSPLETRDADGAATDFDVDQAREIAAT